MILNIYSNQKHQKRRGITLSLPAVEEGDSAICLVLQLNLCSIDAGFVSGAGEGGDLNQHSNPWVRAHARIQRLKGPTSQPGRATADSPADRATAVGSARQMELAFRTSAVVKLLSRSLLAGALQPSRHLTITLGANAGTSTVATAALPSKSVLSDLLDAIETSRTTPRRDGRGGGCMGWWSLNVEGVMLLLRVVQEVRGRRLPAAPAVGGKRPRDDGSGGAGHDGLRGGLRGGGGGAARRWCGGSPGKLGNTVGACGNS